MKKMTSFVCQECGYDSPKYLGKCPECGEWNTLREITTSSSIASKSEKLTRPNLNGEVGLTPKKLSEIAFSEKDRMLTGYSEVDNVLGGGIVKGSVTLLAGDPGIGKSTLLLQIGLNLSKNNKVLYISGEESEEQIKMRSKRINKDGKNDNFLLASLNDTNQAFEIIEKTRPAIAIIDSIQTMESEDLTGLSGSVGQVRYAASSFIKLAKTLGIPIVLIGHVTKEGMVAGPMVLSHMVDTLLFFEGEKLTQTRILRSLKNRFGPIDEVGIFAMNESGLTEIKDPEQLFLGQKNLNTPGSVLTVTMEGTRAFIVEIQALTVFSKLPMPRRVANGIDRGRLELLLAVLQKHCRLPVDSMDVFVNVAGGLKLSDTSSDLAICHAIFSSFKNIPFSKSIAISEVGLLGELRSTPFFEKRAKQARKLGFTKIFSSKEYKTLPYLINQLGKIKSES